jgi:PadR family transcriptional regulator PadR
MRNDSARGSMLQGMLDMLILRTLQYGPAHGHDIARHIRQTSKEVLQIEHGSLYPALHRLERRGWIASKWELHAARKREFRYYRLTPSGRRQLAAEASRWRTLAEAIACVMRAIEER